MLVLGKTSELPHDEICAALDRIVASDVFRQLPHIAAFLRFIVETTLAGEGGRIDGYAIAVEVLGRDEGFDPQVDPIVPVAAGRLRRALQRYYTGTGAQGGIVIELPRGHYVPSFRLGTRGAASGGSERLYT
jgi:hypothetical protein